MNAISPADASAAKSVSIQDLIWVCTTLCELLEIENTALSKHDTATVRQLTENKASLTKLYEKTYMSLGNDKDIKAVITADEMRELQVLGLKLNGLMTANALMLRAGIDARKKVMDIYVNAARKSTENNLNYSKNARFNPYNRGRDRAALAYNKTL